MLVTELNEAQRKALIEKYRDVNVCDSCWYESIYEDYREKLGDEGFSTQHMQFSGFCCQGDGASFTGTLDDQTKFMNKHFPEQYPMVRKAIAQGKVTLKMRSSDHRYCHHNTTKAEGDCDTLDVPEGGVDGFSEGTMNAWNAELDKEFVDVQGQFESIMHDHMRELYSDLEKEYDYQRDDEQVWDFIVSNIQEVDVDEDGDLVLID